MRSFSLRDSVCIASRCCRRSYRLLTTFLPNKKLVDSRNAPSDFDNASAVVYDEFVSQDQGAQLVSDMLSRMKRRRYEDGHWDAVITRYKEVELIDESTLSEVSLKAMDHTRSHLEKNHLSPGVSWLPCHAIDLKRDGELKAHVDSIKFSGDIVAGISFLSSGIMRLRPESGAHDGWVDLLLPPLSLYVLSGVSRYKYTHELLPTDAVFEGPDGERVSVIRDRRLSVIFRDAKESLSSV